MNTSKSTNSDNSRHNGRLMNLLYKVIPKKSPIKSPDTTKEVEYLLGDVRAKVFFGVAFFVLAILLAITFMPYAGALILALLLAAILHPTYSRLQRKLQWSPRMITSLIIVIFIALASLVVFFIIKNLLAEAIALSNSINTFIASGEVNQLTTRLQEILNSLNINISSQDVSKYIVQFLQQFSSQLVGSVTALIQNLFSFFVAVSLFFAALIFLIPRMGTIKKIALEVSPLGRAITASYIEKTQLLLRGTVLGSFAISLSASTIMGVTFYLLGIPNAILFATIAFFLGFIPYLGTAIFTFGAAIIFGVLGQYNQAVILILVQLLLLNQLDLVFRPITVPKKVRIHPALMIIAVLSGLAAFGMLGLIFGPVILVLFISTVEIYRQNYGVEATSTSAKATSVK